MVSRRRARSIPEPAAADTRHGAPPAVTPGGLAPFWERKPLEAMSPPEWELLCDGCGKCCVHKIEDEDTGELFYTDVSCRLLHPRTARCRDYPNRQLQVPDCIALTAADVARYTWLPRSCAYRRLAEGRGLADWHPLVSGDPESVHRRGVSVRGRVTPEDRLGAELIEDRVRDDLDRDL